VEYGDREYETETESAPSEDESASEEEEEEEEEEEGVGAVKKKYTCMRPIWGRFGDEPDTEVNRWITCSQYTNFKKRYVIDLCQKCKQRDQILDSLPVVVDLGDGTESCGLLCVPSDEYPPEARLNCFMMVKEKKNGEEIKKLDVPGYQVDKSIITSFMDGKGNDVDARLSAIMGMKQVPGRVAFADDN
jgi:hypothetical protein